MSEFMIEMVGFMAGLMMSISMIPQSIKTIKTKDTRSISLATFICYNIACVLWFFYGLLLGSLPMIFWNVITFIFAFTILVMKIRHG